MKNAPLKSPSVASPEKWLEARLELLHEEKAYTKQRDRLAALRRTLPWVKVTQPYTFESAKGRVSLSELFEGRSQLAVYHYMFAPGWGEGCKSCSYIADHLVPMVPHLGARDVTLAVVSRAPLPELTAFQKRMGWGFNWVSANDTSFNFDYHASFSPEERASGAVGYNYTTMDFPFEEAPGMSIFAKDAAGQIYHTYSTYGRGVEQLMGTYIVLDLVPMGRNEDPDAPMNWVRYHDSYAPADALAAR